MLHIKPETTYSYVGVRPKQGLGGIKEKIQTTVTGIIFFLKQRFPLCASV
jgi:hypothetical protein